jgi:MFS family permease
MADNRPVPVWRATLSGLCANLVGVGLARFAYTPIIPVLIAAQWFAPSQAAYLGAANLAGYLAGALLARPLAARLAAVAVLRAMMLLTAWFFGWRFAAGFGGGALMVVAAPAIVSHVPASQRGIVSGAIFAGVGLGIAASGTLVALLLRRGLVETWYSLGILALLLTAVAWGGWPRGPVAPASGEVKARGVRAGATLGALCAEYGLSAVGLVPHMVFLVDFIARGRGLGIELGARYWVLFGVSAIAGPVLLGFAADRIGFRLMLRLAFVVDAAAIGLALVDVPVALAVSSIIVGASVSGVVPLALGRVRELVHDEALQRHAWSMCTVAFAVGQAVAAYGFSYVFAQTGGAYVALFAIGAGAFALALALDLGAAVVSRLVRRSGVANGSPQ